MKCRTIDFALEDSGPGDDEEHKHIGFYDGNNEAISNDSKSGTPQKHHWTYGEKDGKPVRKIIAVYRFEFKKQM